MSRLPRLTGKELLKILTKNGFTLVRIEGSHHILRKADGQIIAVPVHAGEEIGPGLLVRIIKKELKITREEFEKWAKAL